MNAKWREKADYMYKMVNSSNLIKKTEKYRSMSKSWFLAKSNWILRLPAMEESKMIDTELTYQSSQEESTESFSTWE